jgi:hypothetical protein
MNKTSGTSKDATNKLKLSRFCSATLRLHFDTKEKATFRNMPKLSHVC